ncbi:F-box protein CPR1-like [Silene latifolia]|uniref:F-box protein CPR1-like n=1 Tax=Silene latifolia TaxID=37657 RepID=UPI003D77E69F
MVLNSFFANAHLMKSPFSHPCAPVNALFIMGSKNKGYLFSYNDDQISGNYKDNLVQLDEFNGMEDLLTLTGCCNGLICLTENFRKYFILWNPATRKLHKYQSHGCFNTTVNSVSIAFGYASSVDDYKYVGISTYYQGSQKYNNIVRIFSLRENRWRKIDFGHDLVLLFRHAVLVGEKLYWGAYRSETGNLIVSFDLGLERFDIIKIDWVPRDFLGVMSGCLSKCNYSETFVGDKLMHILEPPAIVKSIALPKGLKLDIVSEMIGFTKTDKFFVTGSFSDNGRDFKGGMLAVVDTRTKPVQYTTLLRFDEWINIARYFPSLVSPFPIKVPLDS